MLKQLSSLLKISVSILLVFSTLTASGGDPYRPSAGAAEAGTSYVCVMKNGLWPSFHNQAALAWNKNLSLGFNYDNRFNIKELGTRTAALIIPSGKSSLAAIYSNFGYSDFKRNMSGIGCGLKLSEKMSAGVQIDYFSEKTEGELTRQMITCEAGFMIRPSDDFAAGIHIFNPLPNSLRKNYLPLSIRIGAGAYLSKSLFAGVETEMSSGSTLILKTGFEYEALRKICLRGGFSSDNNSFSFGIGWISKLTRLDIGFITNERLGVTSSVSMVFNIK